MESTENQPTSADQGDDLELPKAVVQRIARSKVTQAASNAAGGGNKKPNVTVNKDTLLALQQSAKVFINLLGVHAKSCADEGKRKTINADDVFKALEETEFSELTQPLRQYLEAHKATLKEKPGKKKSEAGGRKRKAAGGKDDDKKDAMDVDQGAAANEEIEYDMHDNL